MEQITFTPPIWAVILIFGGTIAGALVGIWNLWKLVRSGIIGDNLSKIIALEDKVASEKRNVERLIEELQEMVKVNAQKISIIENQIAKFDSDRIERKQDRLEEKIDRLYELLVLDRKSSNEKS